MRNYWSLSKFADALRKAFGISPMLPHGTSEQWDTYNNTAKAQSNFGVKLIDSLDTVQDFFNYIPDKIHGVFYFIKNVKNSSNCLRTNIKIGKWSDLCSRIPEGLLLSVIDFVEKECFWMNIMWADKASQDTWSHEVKKFRNMSYIGRTLFGNVSVEEQVKHGFEYLEFQKENSIDKEPYDAIISAYLFAKEYFANYENTIDKMYAVCDTPFSGSEKNAENYKLINAYEKEVADLVTSHCINIVKFREYLWT